MGVPFTVIVAIVTVLLAPISRFNRARRQVRIWRFWRVVLADYAAAGARQGRDGDRVRRHARSALDRGYYPACPKSVIFRILHCNRAPYSFTARCPLVAVSAKLTQILDDAEG